MPSRICGSGRSGGVHGSPRQGEARNRGLPHHALRRATGRARGARTGGDGDRRDSNGAHPARRQALSRRHARGRVFRRREPRGRAYRRARRDASRRRCRARAPSVVPPHPRRLDGRRRRATRRAERACRAREGARNRVAWSFGRDPRERFRVGPRDRGRSQTSRLQPIAASLQSRFFFVSTRTSSSVRCSTRSPTTPTSRSSTR